MQGSKTIALLLSTNSFEDFYGRGMGLTLEAFLATYRNDFSWYYCDMFAKHGWTPIIYMASLEHKGLYTVDNGVQVRMLALAPWFATIQKLPIWRSKYGRYALDSLNAFAFRQSLDRAIEADGVDILYAQEYWTARFDRLANWFKAKTRPLLIGSDHGGNKAHHLLWFKKRAFQLCTMLTSQTLPEVDDVKRFGVTPVLLPNPVDSDFFQPALMPSPIPTLTPATSLGAVKTVITVARFNNVQKRTTDLIEAFRFLDDTWRLDIYGRGPDEPLLQETISRFGLEKKVRLMGFLGGRDALRDVYQSSSVFSLPSFNEAVAIVVLEAMSCGIPVVVTDIRAFETLIDDGRNGLKVPVGDPSAIAVALQRATAEAETLGSAGRKTVIEHHSFGHFMDTFTAALAQKTAA